MDRSKVEEIVKANNTWMRKALQLQDWTIHYTFDEKPCKNDDEFYGSCAECTPEPGYVQAHMNFVPSRFKDEAEVLKTLRHELLHLVTAQFETYRLAVAEYINPQDMKAIDHVWNYAHERAVNTLETMLDFGLGYSPKQMIKRTKLVEKRDRRKKDK